MLVDLALHYLDFFLIAALLEVMVEPVMCLNSECLCWHGCRDSLDINIRGRYIDDRVPLRDLELRIELLRVIWIVLRQLDDDFIASLRRLVLILRHLHPLGRVLNVVGICVVLRLGLYCRCTDSHYLVLLHDVFLEKDEDACSQPRERCDDKHHQTVGESYFKIPRQVLVQVCVFNQLCIP